VFARSGWLLLDNRDDDDVMHRTHNFGTDASRLPDMISKFGVVGLETVFYYFTRV
jgi:hypothetical protein